MSIRTYFLMVSHVPWCLFYLACLIRVHTLDFFVFFCFFYWSILIVLRLDYLCPICHILIVSYILFSCLTHVILEFIHWVFLLKYSNSNMIRLPMSNMSHLFFSLIWIFLVSQTYSEKPNFLMFVIFLLTQPSVIFTSCGLLVQSHLSPATAMLGFI